LDVDGSGEMEFKEFLHIFRQVALQKKQRKLCRENKDIRSYEDFTSINSILSRIVDGYER